MSGPTGERLPYLVAKMKAPRIAERLLATAERILLLAPEASRANTSASSSASRNCS